MAARRAEVSRGPRAWPERATGARRAAEALVLGLTLVGCAPRAIAPASPGPTMLEEPAPHFLLEDRPFCFVGANSYTLGYESREHVLSVLDAAQELGVSVLRVWGFLDVGALDGSVPHVQDGPKGGVYFQAWDPKRGRPVVHEGSDGLERLDFLIHEAKQRELKLLVVLTNNWRDFGGVDQYVTWFGAAHHHDFYTNARIRGAYKDWALALLTRRSTIDGVLYRDDPTIFGWELANEPRAKNGGPLDAEEGWDARTLTSWADEMSRYLRSLDERHLLSVGDEGFLFTDGRDYFASQGVDHRALLGLPEIDFGTFHLYPDHWDRDLRWAAEWIDEHLALGRAAGKPNVLEEYGLRVERVAPTGPISRGLGERLAGYELFHEWLQERGGAGSFVWMLGGVDRRGPYPDYDGYVIHPGDQTAAWLGRAARSFPSRARACATNSISRSSADPPARGDGFVRVSKRNQAPHPE